MSEQNTALESDDTPGARTGLLEITEDDTPIGTFTRHMSDNTMKGL